MNCVLHVVVLINELQVLTQFPNFLLVSFYQTILNKCTVCLYIRLMR